MLATVRNRRGVVAAVDDYDGREEGRLHLVTIEYTDTDGPVEEQLLWEHEPRTNLISPETLPNVVSDAPMDAREYDALVRATRYNSVTPFVAPDGSGEIAELPVASPFYGAVQVEDFQLIPLLKALRMPRISLMLADDVGLGKTIEAGLILNELILRRRARRILILSPASLRTQWQEEMDEKFSLSFDIVDRRETQDLKKRMGLDANPWRNYSRVIASYHYLRQPHVFEEFRAATTPSSSATTQARLPWDMLIVDEAHNLMPSNIGEDSQLAQMLRRISPWFEHKLFLTATPHNGHTRCFTGLLESLDPVRFHQKNELTDGDQHRIDQVVVRRLKDDINELDDELDRPRRFARRELEPLQLTFGAREAALSRAFTDFRAAVAEAFTGNRSKQLAANFAIEVLNKRLLSTPFAFADSWYRFVEGVTADEEASTREVSAARRASEQELDDDRERESRDRHAARTTGAWAKPIFDAIRTDVDAVTDALERLGLTDADDPRKPSDAPLPTEDARYDRLRALVEERLLDAGDWADDERLIIFTEYKTTLDYLTRRLREDFSDPDGDRILQLFGGMEQRKRDDVKRAFNNPDHPVRILVGTDAASEGLNLQETARLLIHFDVPWNPARLEQRNGRLDRHGQARDVQVFHFTSDNDADVNFMGRVVHKVEQIREDLGSMGEVFDAAFEMRFFDQIDTNIVTDAVDRDVETRRRLLDDVRTRRDDDLLDRARHVEDFGDHIDLTPENLADTLEVALGMNVGYPRIDGPDDDGRYTLRRGLPDDWDRLIEDTLRIDIDDSGHRGALPDLLFDSEKLIDDSSGRPVFRQPKDAVLMHLGHPVLRQALARFARVRFPTGDHTDATRWTVRTGGVPDGADALVVFSVEELAVNELREPFHHWVRTLRFPVHDGQLGDQLPYEPPVDFPRGDTAPREARKKARKLWLRIESQIDEKRRDLEHRLTKRVEDALVQAREESTHNQRERFQQRIEEVKASLHQAKFNKLEAEQRQMERDLQQLELLPGAEQEKRRQLRDLEAELKRRRQRFKQLLRRLERDRDRVLEEIVPRRHTLSGDVKVFPLAVELRLPETSP